MKEILDVRPYQLMCLICRQSSGFEDTLPDRKLQALREAVRDCPDRPIRLRCNVDTVYRFQNPGVAEDTPDGDLFNLKRDLSILQRLGLTPGALHPARVVLRRLADRIPQALGICGYDTVTAEAWQGCERAAGGHYERGLAAGLGDLIPPRAGSDMADAKTVSVAAMQQAHRLDIRPHHLMCMTCFHGGRDHLDPIPQDNLFEAIDILQRHPDRPVRLVHADACVICPPCHTWDPGERLCNGACSLRDQKKDLDVLQAIGLRFGDEMPGGRLLQRLYHAIRSTRQICGNGDGISRSPDWDGCGREGHPAYVKGRAAGIGVPGAAPGG